MGKATAVVFGLGLLGAQGCFNGVKTFDRNGNLLASCQAFAFLTPANGCTGSSNPKDQGVMEPIGPKAERPATPAKPYKPENINAMP